MPPHPLRTLECLALEGCGKIVDDILQSSVATEEDKFKNIVQFSELLHELPYVFADGVTAVMLRYLENHWIKLNWQEEKMQIVALSVIQPDVKAIDITYCPDIGKYVMGAIIHLSNLIKRFPNCNILRGVNVCTSLKKFICKLNCDDKTLGALQSCISIEHIDIRKSWDVTDNCLSTLLDFRKLKYLNIDGTSISQSGVRELLQAFCNRQQVLPLCKFYCSDISTEQLHLLIRCMHLTHIGMGASKCDISGLKSLEYLKSIRLRDCNFNNLRTTFRDIGVKLYEIRFERIEGVDINFIGETFPKLERLEMMNCFYCSLASRRKFEPLPAFKTLRILKLFNIECEVLSYFLDTCCNLFEFELDTTLTELEESFNEITSIVSLEKVEKFILYTRSSRILSKSSMEKLFSNWKNLKVFKNTGIEREDLNIESLKEEIGQMHPNIDVTLTTTRWSLLVG
jgi:hypothetical protein